MANVKQKIKKNGQESVKEKPLKVEYVKLAKELVRKILTR
jgi:hypothetical protein